MAMLDRRQLLKAVSIGGLTASGWLPAVANALANSPKRRRHCILLWMSGGPTQTDTFDLKPNHENGGEFKEIASSVPGLRFSEHLPRLGKLADSMAIVRGLSTKEGDHSRGTHLMRTGHPPMGAARHPAIGAALAKELGNALDPLPSYVSIGAFRAFSQAAFGPGYLGPRHAPLVVGATDISGGFAPAQHEGEGFAELRIESLQRPQGISEQQMAKRLELLNGLQTRFLANYSAGAPVAHQTVYDGAVTLMNSEAATAFDLSEEPDAVREKYGRGLFGQGCLMARRLVEQGVPFIEVTLGGWDTHSNNFEQVATLSEQLDAGWASLMEDLAERGLLESTTILWLGEFGRTPQINGRAGRDHFPRAWSCAFAGGGIAGGQAYGKTSEDGMDVVDGKVGVSDVLATLCSAVGVPPDTHNVSDSGRPLPIVDGDPIKAILA